jgi:ubiquinone/menaquinone biosynthesis C-methylase UbiE
MPEDRMPEYDLLKQNEHKFQNTKYGKTPLVEEKHQASVPSFTKMFLTPVHLGGHPRGEMFQRAVNKLLARGIEGRTILDYCCGRGDLAIFLAMKGAKVCGFDVSEKAIEVARYKAQVNNLSIDFRVMDAENLQYTDNTFDYVIGFEALHHVLIYPKVPSELARVISTDGTIIFAENWGGDNPIFQLWREKTSLKKVNSSERGEVILSSKMLHDRLDPYFQSISVEPLSFFYMAKKYISNPFFLRMFLMSDDKLLTKAPYLGRFYGESVISISNIAIL